MIAVMSDALHTYFSGLAQSERALEEGGFLFYRGDPVTHQFRVIEGTVEVLRHQENGEPLVLQRGVAGSILAEASMFSENYHCDAVAAGPARVAAVPMPELRRLFADRPDFAEAWGRHLAAEMQRSRLRCEILSLRTVAERLDAWLLTQEAPLPAKGDWKSLARQIGVSPEALYRELARRRAIPPRS